MDCLLIRSFFSEIFLTFSFIFQLIYNSYVIKSIKYHLPILTKEFVLQILYCLIILIIISLISNFGIFFFNFLFLNNDSTFFFKVFIFILSFITCIIIYRTNIIFNINEIEFFSLIFLIILSSCLLISSYDLLSIYLALEMQSLCFYALSSFKRNSAASVEAGLKYFIFGSIASCFFLLGSSILYGVFGTLNLIDLIFLFSSNLNNDFIHLNTIIFFSLLLILFVFFFKISIFPFHWWSPDVYEGSPLSSTIIFILLPKIIFFGFIFKWCFIFFEYFFLIKEFCLILGILTVFFGSIFALKQIRLKRFFIFSSIAQVGFLILILITQYLDGYIFIYFFLIVYLVSSVVIWSIYNILVNSTNTVAIFLNIPKSSIFIINLKNFFIKNKYWSLIFFLIFFSLAGIPPLGGFMAKFLIFLELLKNFNFFSTFFLIVLSSLAVYYYIKIIKIIFFESTIQSSNILCIITNKFISNNEYLIITISLLVIILICIFPNIFLLFSNKLVIGLI